ncbi:MAG: hypothetical protein K8L97_14340 [Anaerolineae bacterium]|nr:hypothetical protein [Anaerolineae bacterium]
MSALFWIKLLHTLVFIVESAAILYILYSGLFNVGGTGLVIAVILVLAEIIVYVGNGTRCPLTKVARQLGDATGNDFIADIFLPERFARLIPMVCGGLAVIGLLIVGLRLVMG